MHVDLGLTIPTFQDDHLLRFLKGIDNILPSAPIPMALRREGDLRYRKLILQPDLYSLLESFKHLPDPKTTSTLSLKAAFPLAWYAFLRVADFTYHESAIRSGKSFFASRHLTGKSITFEYLPGSTIRLGMQIVLPSSKTSYLN